MILLGYFIQSMSKQARDEVKPVIHSSPSDHKHGHRAYNSKAAPPPLDLLPIFSHLPLQTTYPTPRIIASYSTIHSPSQNSATPFPSSSPNHSPNTPLPPPVSHNRATSFNDPHRSLSTFVTCADKGLAGAVDVTYGSSPSVGTWAVVGAGRGEGGVAYVCSMRRRCGGVGIGSRGMGVGRAWILCGEIVLEVWSYWWWWWLEMGWANCVCNSMNWCIPSGSILFGEVDNRNAMVGMGVVVSVEKRFILSVNFASLRLEVVRMRNGWVTGRRCGLVSGWMGRARS